MKRCSGFTLVEVLIYAGLTSILIGLFAGILITMTRIQGQQNASSGITSELNFLLSSIKRRINDATSIAFVSSTSIDLITATFPATTTRIFLQNNMVILEENAAPAPISSDRITIDDLQFVNLSNASSVAAQIFITASNNTANPQNALTRTVQTTAIPFVQAQ